MMGARRSAQRRGKQTAASSRPAKTEASSDVVDNLVRDATSHVENGDFDSAIELYKQAATRAPLDSTILDNLADACLEAGRPEDARIALQRSIELSPEVGFEKYMCLSQLMPQGQDAICIARKGIEVLQDRKSQALGGRALMSELRQYEVSAWCSIAETLLHMMEKSGDQNLVEGIERQAEAAVAEAIAAAETDNLSQVESALALANLRLTQGRQNEACSAMLRVTSVIEPGLRILDDIEDDDTAAVKGIEVLPPLEMRIAIGKQLLEVSMWHESIRVLNSTLVECDFNIEVWYMLAVAFSNVSEYKDALHALDMLKEARKSAQGSAGEVDDSFVASLKSTIEQEMEQSPEEMDDRA